MEHFILNQAVTCTANNCPSGHFSLPATEDVIFNSLLLNNNFCSTVSLSERKKKKTEKKLLPEAPENEADDCGVCGLENNKQKS